MASRLDRCSPQNPVIPPQAEGKFVIPAQAGIHGLSVGRRLSFLLPLLVVLGFAGNAAAAELGDPTEAPAEWLARQPGATAAEMVPADATPRMQVLLKSKSRKLVLIDGEVIKVGDEYRGTKVVAIEADKVVMEDASKSLRVTPNVKKTAPVMAKAKKTAVVVPAGSVSSKAQ